MKNNKTANKNARDLLKVHAMEISELDIPQGLRDRLMDEGYKWVSQLEKISYQYLHYHLNIDEDFCKLLSEKLKELGLGLLDTDKLTYPYNVVNAFFTTPEPIENLERDKLIGYYMALHRVDDAYVDPFLLYYKYGMTYKEVAHACGYTPERARQKIAYAWRSLRGYMYNKKFHYIDILNNGLKSYIDNYVEKTIQPCLDEIYAKGYNDGQKDMEDGVFKPSLNITDELLDKEIDKYRSDFNYDTCQSLPSHIHTIRDLIIKPGNKIPRMKEACKHDIAKRLAKWGIRGTVWDEFLHDEDKTPISEKLNSK